MKKSVSTRRRTDGNWHISAHSCLWISRNSIATRISSTVDYYYTSGILESDDEEVDIDLEVIAEYVCKRANDEGFCSSFNPEEVFFIVQADLDFQEQNV